MIIIMTLYLLGIGRAFAFISECQPVYAADHLETFMNFNINSNTNAITPNKILATDETPFLPIKCLMNGKNHKAYFKITMPENIRNMLLDSGVEVYQKFTSRAPEEEHNITLPSVPNFTVINLNEEVKNEWTGFVIRYLFTLKKGNSALKPFDTGVFLLGYHINDLGINIGAPIYARFLGNLTLLCPTPNVNIVASNGGSVNFGNITPQELQTGSTISKNFNLNMTVPPDCETGLNISVRFEPNNNTLLDNKKLDMDNGLQMQLSNSNGDVNYNEPQFVGELPPSTPLNLSYGATLSHIPGRQIVSGPFSKTIRVVVSY